MVSVVQNGSLQAQPVRQPAQTSPQRLQPHGSTAVLDVSLVQHRDLVLQHPGDNSLLDCLFCGLGTEESGILCNVNITLHRTHISVHLCSYL